jgi:hypothetical protein
LFTLLSETSDLTIIPAPRNPERDFEQSPPERYDQKLRAGTRFDHGSRLKPQHQSYWDFEAWLQTHTRYGMPTTILETVAAAQIALKTRGLVGVVLGSLVAYLANPPDDPKLFEEHGDVDVLILQPHSRIHPRPGEWAVDWWIRPGSADLKPTNGHTFLWYDLALSDSAEVDPKYFSPSRLQIDTQAFETRIDHSVGFEAVDQLTQHLRNSVGKLHIPAGLYLPPDDVMETIRDHCQDRSREKLTVVAQMKEYLTKFSETLDDLVEDSKLKLFQGSAVDYPKISEESRMRLEKILGDLDEKKRQYGLPAPRYGDFLGTLDLFLKKHGAFRFLSIPDFYQEFLSTDVLHILAELEDGQHGAEKDYQYLTTKRYDPTKAMLPQLPSRALQFLG